MRKSQILYQQVCVTYFPRWKPWNFEYTPQVSFWSGSCDVKRKTIYFSSLDPLLIIHEICHAVTDGYHNKHWQNRMLLAAKDAEHHDPNLSKKLIWHVKTIREGIDLIPVIPQRIEDAISELVSINQPVDVDQVVIWALDDCLHREYDAEKYDRNFNRMKRIAEKALKSNLKMKARLDVLFPTSIKK